MKTQTWITGAALAGALLIGGGAALTATAMNEPAPTPTPTVTPTVTPTPTPTPEPEPEPVVEPAPAPAEAPAPAPAPEPEPVLCPPGTQANSSDGFNDTSCFPVICFGLTLPDPAHPECDYAYPPEYYY